MASITLIGVAVLAASWQALVERNAVTSGGQGPRTLTSGLNPDDWPTFMGNIQRTGNNTGEKTLSPITASLLHNVWTYKTGGPIEGPATVVNGTVYVGSWDGYEYALNASTGTLVWKTFLGQTTNVNCFWMSPIGVTSGATVSGQTLYVTGGDAQYYSLNALTGAINWHKALGVPGAAIGTYLWASPLLYNGNLYIGNASQCDNPLVQGKLVKAAAATGVISNTFYTVGSRTSYQDGGSIWSTPALDPNANTVWMTTGNEGSGSTYARSIVALDATTLALRGFWQQPLAGYDYDFGAGPTIADNGGHSWVFSTNKDGYTYAFNRSNVTLPGWGPIWKDQTTSFKPLTHPPADAISPAAWDGSTLYVGGGNTSIGGAVYQGSVRAINPSNGAYLWQHPSPGVVRGGVAVSDGLIVDNAVSKAVANQSTLEVLSAATGSLLWNYSIPWAANSNPTIAEGKIFVGSGSTGLTGWNTFPGGGGGYLYAFGIYLNPSYNQGCNGNQTAQRLQWHSGVYGYSWSGPTASGGYYLPSVSGTDWAQSPPTSSNITTVQYYMVGPHGLPNANTCYTPTANHVGVTASYTWTVNWSAQLTSTCAPGQLATANFALSLAANVHISSYPWYVAPGHSTSVTVAANTITCTSWLGGGGPVIVTLNFGPFNVTAGVTYDFYTAMWQSAFTQLAGSPGSTTYATVSWQAAFDYGGCSCP